MRFIYLFATLLAIGAQLIGANTVQTTNGPLTGTTKTVGDKSVNQYLGIPYAKPPIGNLRFKKTQPVENWNGTLQANKWSPICTQLMENPLNLLSAQYLMNANQSEDCLYLNIWAPNAGDNKKRPVMIFIHGGGLVAGTASFDVYNGEMLAAKSDSIVVTLNYRLGILGFLYSDTDTETYPGNQAMYDQLEAMKWIKNNIAKFGGDANKITLVGESAGSWMVSAHIMSPLSRNYFNQAVLQSGAATTDWALTTPQNFVKDILVGINALGCGINSTHIDATVIACLNNYPPNVIDLAYYQLGRHPYKLLYPLIVSPSPFLPKTFKQAFDSKDFHDDIALLISTVENEGPLFTLTLGERYAYVNPAPITKADALGDAKNWTLVQTNQDLSSFIKTNYFPITMINPSADKLRKRVTEMVGDAVIACPTMGFAERVFTASNNRRAKVYQLHFKMSSGTTKMWCAPWGKPCHSDDLFPTFAFALRHPNNATPREIAVSNEYMEIFESFLHNGRPTSNIVLRPWKPYKSTLLLPYYEIGDGPRTLLSYKKNLKKHVCKRWNQYTSIGA